MTAVWHVLRGKSTGGERIQCIGEDLPRCVWGLGSAAVAMLELRAGGRAGVHRARRRDRTLRAEAAVCAEAPGQEGGVILRQGRWGGGGLKLGEFWS